MLLDFTLLCLVIKHIFYNPTPGGGGVLPSKRLRGMCRWIGSHFHDWIDYNGVAFSIEVLKWGRIFSGFGGGGGY